MKVLALGLVGSLVVACGQHRVAQAPRATPTEKKDPSHAYNGVWLLTEGEGPQGRLDPKIGLMTLVIEGRRAHGATACNGYDGKVEIDGSDFRIYRIFVEEAGCGAGRYEAEEAYLAALVASDTIRRRGRELKLAGRDARLRYELVLPPPDAPLVGTRWSLESIFELTGPEPMVMSPALLADEARVVFGRGGMMLGTTGCRRFTARWKEERGEVIVSRFRVAGHCDATDSGLRLQDQRLIDVLAERFRPVIDGNWLTLRAPDSDLAFRYEAPCDLKPKLRCRI